MNIMTVALSEANSFKEIFLSEVTSGSVKPGAIVPSGSMFEGVRAMIRDGWSVMSNMFLKIKRNLKT